MIISIYSLYSSEPAYVDRSSHVLPRLGRKYLLNARTKMIDKRMPLPLDKKRADSGVCDRVIRPTLVKPNLVNGELAVLNLVQLVLICVMLDVAYSSQSFSINMSYPHSYCSRTKHAHFTCQAVQTAQNSKIQFS